VKAVQKAKTTDPEKVIAALPGTETPNLTGGIAKVLPNHHITKPVFIGEVKADGQFNVVWKIRRAKCRATPGPTTCRAARTSKRIG
jgi:urea transport system substrate-binding protein